MLNVHAVAEWVKIDVEIVPLDTLEELATDMQRDGTSEAGKATLRTAFLNGLPKRLEREQRIAAVINEARKS